MKIWIKNISGYKPNLAQLLIEWILSFLKISLSIQNHCVTYISYSGYGIDEIDKKKKKIFIKEWNLIEIISMRFILWNHITFQIWWIEMIFCKYVIILNILIISKPLKILQKKTKNKLIKQIIVYILRLFYCF